MVKKIKKPNYSKLTFNYLILGTILTYLINVIQYFLRVETFTFGISPKPGEISFFFFGLWNVILPWAVCLIIIGYLIALTWEEFDND